MFQTRSLSTVLVASLGLAAGLAIFSSQNVSAAPEKPCTGTISDADAKENAGLAKVKEACASGGKDAAKKVMNELSKKAGLKCESCHKDNGPTYATKDNALSDFKSKLGK